MHYGSMLVGLFMVASAWSNAVGISGAQDYDFKDPKGVNAITFLLDSPLEPIMGIASGISGTVKFDPAAPNGLSGKLIVDVRSLHLQNDSMLQSLFSGDWLEAERHKTIEFAIKSVKDVKPGQEGVFDMNLVGDFTCKGVTKEMTVPVRATYLAGKMKERLRGKEGDLLVLRSNFVIKRKDFNIKPQMGNDVVAEDIQLTVSIVGSCPK